MAKIIIVDDKKSVYENISKVIKPLLFKFEEDIETKYFNKLNKSLKEEINDISERKIYILDIDLESTATGIDIASLIREEDWESEIIFLTSHDNYFEKVYRNIFKVFAFIEKFDHMESRIYEAVEKILNKSIDNKMFVYKNSQIELRIFYKDIIYIHRDKNERKLIIETKINSFAVNKTVDAMLESLDERFKKVHRSCIVNLDYINEFNWSKGEFTLTSGKSIPLLSKKYKKEVGV